MNYKATIKWHFPTDPPWRDKPESKTSELHGESPSQFLAIVLRETFARLKMGKDEGFFIGEMCNIINGMPEAMRMNIVAGIIQGLGLTMQANEDGQLVGTLAPMYTALAQPGPEGQPERRTASGLILPESAGGLVRV